MLSAGRFSRSGMTETVNGSFREYQNGPSTLCRGPLPYFHQHAGMHAHNLLDHTQVQAPYQQCHNNPVLHGVNHSGNRFHLGPRIPVLFSNSERTFGPPHHPLLANPVNHRNIRILPPEVSLYFTLCPYDLRCAIIIWVAGCLTYLTILSV
jgi:E3 ubiquitin-protein ligase RNF38/44